ncbi:hypothetical protein PHYBLDRAFT_140145 [Phycomyces blakesleeanus NRRL 1555(-)]|uniref:Uncharacterized protein n=1 Tax=Phycomyces blakesleeanus (strain ATCC 8743b / DSM 1359 / FGSC 10004 / NBRC 33097 / NRRL 1555) TaxID=763407 RepID=A0A162V5F9_PHYB8|nr:hypothetical protein PHYBLDRAFT_140145 [Phycomyces blakesleeanus NRRL 1555(-)]OAD80132.1 hypothetical protein PHYBLDRAFT_140145 [Phycomyces blakesleeanus NRRL 1555(-)]|eukprot:XP_018298172.1 hypothetical protein PHYBLDRAFT_140145 [Phycomyces blakesleeanus NRRL 1555(-)]
MPFPSRRQQHIKRMVQNRMENAARKNKELLVCNLDIEDLNTELEETKINSSSPILQWREGAGKEIPGVYRKDLSTTMWRKRKTEETLIENAKSNYKLEDLGFFRLTQSNTALVENTISETSQEGLFDAETESENEKI